MRFIETTLPGVYLIEPEPLVDERGFFARTFCEREFVEHGLNPQLVQCSVSFNERQATLRGMHYQRPPHEETKLVRCTAGAIYDLIIDLRKDSATHGQSYAVELNSRNLRMLYIPAGFAHGFQTLLPGSEVFYQMSELYTPGSSAGVRWNDPAFGIDWPFPEPFISERDANYPDYVR